MNSLRLNSFFSFLILSFILILPGYAFSSEFNISWQAFLLSPEDGELPSDKSKDEWVAVSVTIDLPEESYIYGPSEDSEGLPTNVVLRSVYTGSLPKEQAVSVLAPQAKYRAETKFANIDDAKGPLIYAEPATFLGFVPVKNGTVTVNLQASGLLCSELNCTPFDEKISIPFSEDRIKQLPVAKGSLLSEGLVSDLGPVLNENSISASSGSTSDAANPTDYSSFLPQYFNPDLEVYGLGSAIFFGLLAGLILNLMPCVLPVISLKFSGLMAVSTMTDRREQAKRFRIHCLLFAAGVMTWFMVLALLLGLAGMAWGQMFQSPVVVGVLALILFMLGLSLFGVFDLPIFDLKVAGPSHPHWQAYASGLLATFLATPCSGPLLGGVLGWALLQPLDYLIITITSVGIGMAFPYCVMAMVPRLVHLLPKPGNWTLRLEQLLGFFLMGSVLYMSTLLPPNWLIPFLICLMAIAFAAWLWGQIGHLGASTLRRILSRTAAVLTIAGAIWVANIGITDNFNWEPFDPYAFSTLVGQEPLLVEFTADWCPSCKALEHTTLNERRMAKLRAKYKMRTIRVDLTRDGGEGKDLLESLGSKSIPVVALFPTGDKSKEPMVLRDLFTPAQLKDALKQTF